MSESTFYIRIAQASICMTVGLFYWTRFPDPHVEDESLAVFSLCTSLNGYIMLFSGCHNLIMLSQVDDVIFEDCTRNDIARFVQFAITCPLFSWQVSLLARSKKQRQVELVLCTFLMLALGLWANATPEFSYRMMAFGLGGSFFVLLVVNLDWAVRETSENHDNLFKGKSNLRYIAVCVVVTWVAFPITWIIGPMGARVIPPQAEVIVLSTMDLISKLAFSAYVYYIRSKWTATLQQEKKKITACIDKGEEPPEELQPEIVTGRRRMSTVVVQAGNKALKELQELHSPPSVDMKGVADVPDVHQMSDPDGLAEKSRSTQKPEAQQLHETKPEESVDMMVIDAAIRAYTERRTKKSPDPLLEIEAPMRPEEDSTSEAPLPLVQAAPNCASASGGVPGILER
uniref:Uncharacterized protein n=1 Tax=Chromera velia CCMP2878 TaxID=1169474 RepID=A0A0G4F8P7_9ALVE|eukprot:Cvel_15662.t1-p1 / transcript=Cvel_15662.t1 / gene=Cvel_15662 / organism=Chromera_velia_CCMP2878 / gene_product=Sensory rhodopsin-2, putative / transcript_product=Sensory rhodopsin-2, putative / location=Cvel_scaffold1169:20157-23125(-) / protein_length=399 / sequence_SO=supercontig / SO=protein_coding / is_pseudo=false